MSTIPLLTPAEVAARLGVTTHTLAVWRCTRQHLKFIKVGRLVRYPESEVARFLEHQTEYVDTTHEAEGRS